MSRGMFGLVLVFCFLSSVTSSGVIAHVDPSGPLRSDTDGDGRSDKQELLDHTNPLNADNIEKTFYVSDAIGNDAYDGLAEAWDGIHGPKKTLQAGIDATVAGWGYTVLVADGTYAGPGNGDLHIDGKDITFRSANGPTSCIIDATASDRALELTSGETSDTTIDGFTFTNADYTDEDGGAILCEESSPTIRNCRFTNNFAGAGAGIYSDNASPVIRDCEFTYNESEMGGGAICCGGGGAPQIIDCIIVDNEAGVAGGGIHCNGCNPMIIRCTIASNYAVGSYGGGLSCNNASPDVRNCTIANNRSGPVGGGVMIDTGSSPTIRNCLITGNSTLYDGGGAYVVGATPTFVNCTIVNNEGASWSSGGVYCYSGTTTIHNSIIWGNANAEIHVYSETLNLSHCTVEGGWTGTDIVTLDPYFADPDGADNDASTWEDNDFRMTFGSHSIDAGDNGQVPLYVFADLDEQPRLQDDPATDDTGLGTAPIIDHGCYEYSGVPTLAGDFNRDDQVDLSDFSMMANCMSGPANACSINCEFVDLDGDRDVDLEDFASLQILLGQ